MSNGQFMAMTIMYGALMGLMLNISVKLSYILSVLQAANP